MILVEFEPAEPALRQAVETDLLAIDSLSLLADYFRLPIRLRVGETELFEQPRQGLRLIWTNQPGSAVRPPAGGEPQPSRWLALPLLDFALMARETVRDLPESGETTLDADYHDLLEFRLDGDRVWLYSHANGQGAAVPYPELRQAFEQFAERVGAYLARELPQLVQRPEWAQWFGRTSPPATPRVPGP